MVDTYSAAVEAIKNGADSVQVNERNTGRVYVLTRDDWISTLGYDRAKQMGLLADHQRVWGL